jgi:hypothetical protein
MLAVVKRGIVTDKADVMLKIGLTRWKGEGTEEFNILF